MSKFEDMSYEPKDTTSGNKKGFKWKLLSIVTSALAIVLLFGIWYVNNERAFLAIENTKLKVEIEKLNEEIQSLQASIAQNDNRTQETGGENRARKDDDEDGDGTSTSNTGTSEGGTETRSDYTNYVVKPGDTLNGISLSLYGTESYASQIAQLNGLPLESVLQVDQTLKVPKKPAE